MASSPVQDPDRPDRPAPLADAAVRRLAAAIEPVSPTTRAAHVYERFVLDARLHAVPVVQGNQPVGLVARDRFCPFYVARYGTGAAATETIDAFMDADPLVIDENATLDELADVIVEQGGRYLHDGFIVSRRGEYAGVGTCYALLRALTERRSGPADSDHHDPLTGLPSAPLFDDRLNQAVAAADRARGRLAVLIADIEGLEGLVTEHGRATGDEVLARVGSRLRQAVRKGDTIARLADRRFGLLLPAIAHAEAARLVARKVIDSVVAPMRVAGADVAVSCGVGISMFPDDAAGAKRLVRCAAQACEHAREARRSIEWYREELTPDLEQNVCSYGTLRQAIEDRRLLLVYQPQMDLATGRVCGVEALVRWPQGDGPNVAARDIIAVAENSGLIVPLADWALSTACRQMRTWHDAGVFVVRLAINVSGVQLRQQALASIVARMLRDTGVPPAALEIELAEGVVARDDAGVDSTIEEVRRLGVRLSIDDFGTGCLSLRRLVQMAADSIKLDRSLVEPLGTDAGAERAISAAIALAHALGLKVIAEGVETAHQLRILRNHRCDVAQGYFFSRPVPAEQIAGLAAKGDGLVDPWPESRAR